jgi:hypothetical protein
MQTIGSSSEKAKQPHEKESSTITFKRRVSVESMDLKALDSSLLNIKESPVPVLGVEEIAIELFPQLGENLWKV